MKNTAFSPKNDCIALIKTETERLTSKYGKSFLCCEELAAELSIGRDNARKLMNNIYFPTVKIGHRKVVSIVGFVAWIFENKGGVS